jgi:hypothetical protein
MANPFTSIKNYWFPSIDPLTGTGQGITRETNPQHVSRYIARVQLARIRQDVKSWRDSINEAELAYYPHRVQMQRLFNDTALNGHVYACMEKRKSLTKQKRFEIIDEKGVVDEFWTEKLNKKWLHSVINYSLDAIFYGYNLVNYSEIENDELKGVEVIKRHNISPDRLQVVSYVYALSGIQFETDEQFKDWVFYVSTTSETGISNCGYGLLYRCGIYEIFLRNLLGYNGDYVELFSQPFRVGKTQKTNDDDRSEFESAIRDMGSSGYAIIDPNDEIDFIDAGAGSGAGYLGYENLEKRCEAKISKIILGHADAIDSTPGKLGANDTVTEALEIIEKQDSIFVMNVINDEVLPKLRNQGLNIPDNLKFSFCNDKEKYEEQEKTNKRNNEVIANVKTLFDAGYKVDVAQIEELTGLKITEIEPTSSGLTKDVQNKLKDLYNGI